MVVLIKDYLACPLREKIQCFATFKINWAAHLSRLDASDYVGAEQDHLSNPQAVEFSINANEV